MAYIHWNPDPIVFDIGFYSLRWYALFFAICFASAYLILYFIFRKEKIENSLLDKLTVYFAIGTIAGARIGHCLFYEWPYYSKNILEIFLPFQLQPSFKLTGFHGLASHGAGVGIIVALILFARKHKWSTLGLFDKIALVLPLGGGFVRLGNLMNSEIIGKPTQVKWAFIFEKVDFIPRHPSQIYEALAAFLIFAFLLYLHPKWKNSPGKLTSVMLTSVFCFRFLIEFVKADQTAQEANYIINTGQYLSIPFILAGLLMFFYCSNKNTTKIKTKA